MEVWNLAAIKGPPYVWRLGSNRGADSSNGFQPPHSATLWGEKSSQRMMGFGHGNRSMHMIGMPQDLLNVLMRL